jgi:hypothetical protein
VVIRHAVFASLSSPFFEGLPDRLYRNKGDGTFEDVSSSAGILAHVGKGMSAAIAISTTMASRIYSSPTTPFQIFFPKQGQRQFEEIGLAAGCRCLRRGVQFRAWAWIFRTTTMTGGRMSS